MDHEINSINVKRLKPYKIDSLSIIELNDKLRTKRYL